MPDLTEAKPTLDGRDGMLMVEMEFKPGLKHNEKQGFFKIMSQKKADKTTDQPSEQSSKSGL